jgi:DNA-binding beta-propeller fold protein YncE
VAVDEQTGRAFVANDDDASVSVLDTHRGALVRTLGVGPHPHAIALDPQIHRAFVVNTGDDTLSVLDTSQGVVLHTIHIDATPDDTDDVRGLVEQGSSVPPPYAPQPYSQPQSFSGGFTGGFFGFAQESAVVDSRTHRVFVDGIGVVRVLDARSGAVVNTVTLPGDNGQMAVDRQTGQVFVAGENGVSVLDSWTGQVRRTLAAGGPASAVAVDGRRGRVFVAHKGPTDSTGTPIGTGSVSMLDARSGAVLRTMSVGVAPVALAVDERTGRAVVLNAGGPVQAHTAWTWLPSSLQRWVPFSSQQMAHTRTVPGSVSVLDAGR